MVDYSDIDRVNQLVGERRQIDAALNMLDRGMDIVAFGLGTKATESSGFEASLFMVDASYMETPPQMMETIKTLMHQREDQIASELSAIGVTGAEAQARGAPPPPPPPRGAIGESQPHRAPAAPHPRNAPAKPAPPKRR